MCAKNSDILLAETSIIMHTENSISDEGSDAGENEQYLNASASKFQMFPSTSTSTFCPSGYNFGCFNSLAIEHNELSALSVDISHKRDKRRLAQSEKKNSSDWKKKRISNKLAKSSKITRNIKKEGETYGPGKF
ncbi:hypothetical protein TNIN_109781 [Trichonephila inaurata madagascariensis]|uniref:Uncharacterized protein n=1 Tax=Trichonephila inaurata madagascariensis TaxID=2747483 RepID=A0A8X6WWV9_9ARAC|nr:hypothetical protein TNIN_109781 [Trichonephila inaurata madagascariensis]